MKWGEHVWLGINFEVAGFLLQTKEHINIYIKYVCMDFLTFKMCSLYSLYWF